MSSQNRNKIGMKGFAFKVKSSSSKKELPPIAPVSSVKESDEKAISSTKLPISDMSTVESESNQAMSKRKRTTFAPEHSIHEEDVNETTKAPVPIAETPIIKHNKKLRNTLGGRRRSSIGLRGKRLSAMMNSGQIGSPHPSISPSDYYKLIDADLPDAARMRQLLTWCAQFSATRYPVIQPKKSSSPSDIIFRKIQQDIITGLANKTVNTSWYEFNNDNGQEEIKSSQKPHPLNIEHAQKLAEFKAEMQKCLKEEEDWLSIKEHLDTKSRASETVNEASSKTEVSIEKISSLPEKYKTILQHVDTTSGSFQSFLSMLYEQENLEAIHLRQQLHRAFAMTDELGRKCEGIYSNLLHAFENIEDQTPLDAIDVLRLFSKTASTSTGSL